MVLGEACQRELVDVHVAGEIVERMRETIDGELGHGDRERRLGGDLCGKRHGGVEGLARIGHLLHQAPLVGLSRRDALVSQDHRLLGAGRADQMQHAWHALPAHVHAEADLGDAHMGIAPHDAEIECDRERHAAADAEPFDGADGDLLHVLPCAGQPRTQFEVSAQRAEVHGLTGAAFGILEVEAGGECVGAAGQHDHGGGSIILKASRRVG